MRRLKTALWLVVVNLTAVALGAFLATEWFIARKAKTTLVYTPNPHYRQDLSPNQTYTRDGFEYRIGPHGLRGVEPVTPKPPGVRRVAVMGGSSVFDFRVGTSWPERLQTKLRDRGLERIEVFNAGVPGFSTREVIPFLERKIAAYAPDVVVLYAGWNDVKYMKASRSLPEVKLRPYPKPRPGARDPYAWLTAPRPYRNWYALPILWGKVRLRAGVVEENTGAAPARAAPPAKTKTSTLPPPAWADSAGMRYWEANLRRFVEAVRAVGAEPVFVLEATLYASDTSAADKARITYRYVKLSHEELVEVSDVMTETLQRVAAELRVPVIDPRPDLRGRSAHFHDHVHLTEAGSEALAEAVLPELATALREIETSTTP